MVMSPNLSRQSRQFQIRVRKGGRAMPPATKTRFLPKNSSIGKELPYGPRTPIVSPTSRRRSSSVTRPTERKQHSIEPVRVGDEAMQKVDSPAPKAEYSPNCPARKVKLSRTASS